MSNDVRDSWIPVNYVGPQQPRDLRDYDAEVARLRTKRGTEMACGCVVTGTVWDSTHCTVPGVSRRSRQQGGTA